MMKTIKTQQLQYLSHCMRDKRQEKIIPTGKIVGKKASKGSHFSKELQYGMGYQGLSFFSAQETGMNGINWSSVIR